MSREKIRKLVALALNNSHPEEAASAFRKAFIYAQREGVSITEFMPMAAPQRPSRSDFAASFNFDMGNAVHKDIEISHLRRLNHNLEAALGAERESHGKTIRDLHEARNMIAGYQESREKILADLESLGNKWADHLKEKNEEIQHKDWEIAALKRQIALLQGES